MTTNELKNLRAFQIVTEGKEDELPFVTEMYLKYIKGEDEAWKDLEWKDAKKLEWWTTRWELDDKAEVKA